MTGSFTWKGIEFEYEVNNISYSRATHSDPEEFDCEPRILLNGKDVTDRIPQSVYDAATDHIYRDEWRFNEKDPDDRD